MTQVDTPHPDVVKESDVDVLIIGAGPAGLMCANALAHAGVNVRIVDKKSAPVVTGQADGIQPRTIEIMQSYGLAENFLKKAEHIWKSVFYNPSPSGGIERTTRSSAVSALAARWPFKTTLNQGSIESIFLESMRSKGLEVDRAVVPTLIELSKTPGTLNDPDAYAVTTVLAHLDRTEHESEIVHARFVLGADGAHSWVRKTLGIEMEGDNTDSIWGVLDIVPDTDFPDIRTQAYIHSSDAAMFIVPRENDIVRLYIQLSATSELIDSSTNRVDKNRASPETILEEARKIMHPYKMRAKDGHVDWWTVYVVGQRVAESYSLYDRAFIAGDACHTHTPKAGQGMNASMGDTHNLAWKLAYVLRGWADMSLLKTYELERRTYAQNLINFDKKWSKLFTGKPRTETNENGVTHEEFIGTFKTFGGFTSGIGIHYDPSTIVSVTHQALAPKLIVGERMVPHVFIRAANGIPVEVQDLLPADTRFKILFFAGSIAVPNERARLQKVADELSKPESFLGRFGRGERGDWKVFDVFCFSPVKQDQIDYLDFPEFFRPHWSKVLLDDTDTHGMVGGAGYEKYGIDQHAGAVVVVRPDGYVGTVAPLDSVELLDQYFSTFMVQPAGP